MYCFASRLLSCTKLNLSFTWFGNLVAWYGWCVRARPRDYRKYGGACAAVAAEPEGDQPRASGGPIEPCLYERPGNQPKNQCPGQFRCKKNFSVLFFQSIWHNQSMNLIEIGFCLAVHLCSFTA